MILIEIMGHLGSDPETRFTPSGQKVISFRVATNVRKAGKDETVWWRVTVWGDRFDKMISFLKKGSAVIVIGEMQKPEIWTDKEGRPQISLDLTAEMIRFSPFGKPDRPQQETSSAGQSFGAQTGTGAPSYGEGRHSSFQDSKFAEASYQSPAHASPGQTSGYKPFANEEEDLPF